VADDWHALSVEEGLKRLETSPPGLLPDEAKRRLAQYGPNELQQLAKISPWKIFLSQFLNVLVVVLIIAAFISGALGVLKGQVEELYDAALIGVIVILNSILGFVQEYRAEKSLEALRSLAAPKAHVIRGGESVFIPAQEVVPGDIVVLTTGEKVPADGRLIESVNLRANEASLTGESVPVSKTTAPLPAKTFLADRRNLVFAATLIDSGRGKAVVIGTGMSTELGKIAGLVQQETSAETPLQKQLNRLGRQLGVVILAISAFVFVFGLLRKPGEIETLFLTAVSLSVAAIPERFGETSQSTTSAHSPRSAVSAAPSRMSPLRTVTPEIGAISSKSMAMTFPPGRTFPAATCDQLPGAAPRSTTVIPGSSKRSFASIPRSLNAARER